VSVTDSPGFMEDALAEREAVGLGKTIPTLVDTVTDFEELLHVKS